jgi:nicotinamide-nucleotide amidase
MASDSAELYANTTDLDNTNPGVTDPVGSPPLVADIIAVGTELLLGEVINSNAAWLSQALSAIGVHVYYHHTVGDNIPRIHHLLNTILNRADNPPSVLLFSGGLGPTPDDLTLSAIASYFKTELIHDAGNEQHIRHILGQRGITITDNNLKQALRPADALVVPNPMGTAPGIWWQTPQGCYVATFPGVPRELKTMWPRVEEHLLAMQRQNNSPAQRLFCRYLHFFGISESKLAQVVDDLLSQQNPTVAPYVDRAHVKLRLACLAPDEATALPQLDTLENIIISRVPDAYLTSSTGPLALEHWVGDILKAKHATIALAESCTGGLISHRLTNVPGSSAFIFLNKVAYSNKAKVTDLGVPPDILLSHGAVSVPVVLAMARHIRYEAGTTYGLAISGIAGPDGGSATKPVGTAYIAISGPNGHEMVQEVKANPRYDREDIKFAFSQHALVLLAKHIQQQVPQSAGGNVTALNFSGQ